MSKKKLVSKPAPKKAVNPQTAIMQIVKDLPELTLVSITTDEQFEAAREEYKRVCEIESNLLAKKKAILDPLNTAISELKTLFKPAEARIFERRDAFSLELTRYANSREIARLKALEKLNTDKRIKSIGTIQDKREAIGDRSSGTMKIRKLVIDDPTKVPNEFWVIDEVLLKKALVGGRKVAGASLVEELTVTAR